MSFKTIVTVIRGEADGKRILESLAPIVEQQDSHLIGVHAETTALAYMPAIGAEAVTYDEAIIEANRQRMKTLEKWFAEHCKREMISWEWRGFENFTGDSAVSAVPSGFAADLIVAQQADPDNPNDIGDDLEALLFESGRPVLIIPYTAKGPLKLDRVMIAWKDSREAARAVFDSIPFLRMAGKVEVLVVDPQDTSEHSGAMTAADIAAALDRHGIAVEINNQTSGNIPIAAAVENRISDAGIDLMVMGAYSRMRLSERIFGGVTQTIMRSMTTPTLFSR